MTGQRPRGWHTGTPGPNTRRLLIEEGGFLYDLDACNDDLPYWHQHGGAPHLVIPFNLDVSDVAFASRLGFGSVEQFFTYLRDAFAVLYEEGKNSPKMMSISLHSRLACRPGQSAALARFQDAIGGNDNVWICRRLDIAKHWHALHDDLARRAKAETERRALPPSR